MLDICDFFSVNIHTKHRYLRRTIYSFGPLTNDNLVILVHDF